MNERPEQTWSVEQLGTFCLQSQKKLAVDAWRFGQALNLARAKQEHGQWQVWKNKYVPFLTHSSEHRYRQLANRLTEDSLEGIGLTEAYRLLDLTYTKSKAKSEDLFPDAPKAVACEADDFDQDDRDDFDDLKVMPPDGTFSDLPPAIRLMEVEANDDGLDDFDGLEVGRVASFPNPTQSTGPLAVEAEPEHPRTAIGLLQVEPEDEIESAATLHGDQAGENRYRLLLTQGRRQMDALRRWAEWLKQQDKGFRLQMWQQHGIEGTAAEIGRTIEELRWLAENVIPS